MTPDEKRKESAKRYYEANKEKCKERTKEHPACKAAREKYRNKPEVKEQRRNYRLLQTYGITNKDYEKKLEEQQFCCAGCGLHQNETNKKFNVDHCHESGLIRGLLCGNCNRGLGLLKDNKQTLLALYSYLEKYHGA